ncbi:MAG: FAD-dependent oxidoreductase, partial [Candidatus Phytoplasma australasiaticum]|nr:FAD-dependent oxidoreductase [Candidatus Phytoplasma australasiaticum]
KGMLEMKYYQSIVVGGGHAGVEAALALAKQSHKTLLFVSIITSFTGSQAGYYRAYYTIYIFEVGWIWRVDLPMGRLCLV